MAATDRVLMTHFASLHDPRIERTKLHPLANVLTIAICAVIGGAESWDDIAAFGQARAAWFATFLDLGNGIPSHDTFNRVFAALDPAHFQDCFLGWVRAITAALPAQVIALDGKTLRRSHDRRGGTAAVHLVSAWAATNRLVLTQRQVDATSNEITAIPEVLRALAVQGCLVTIDALDCQRAIAQQMLDQGGDYALALKDNQPTLAADVQECFAQAQQTDVADVAHTADAAVDKGHGRLEVRRRWVITDPAVIAWLHAGHQWPGLQAVGLVETERRLAERTTIGRRYYRLSRSLHARDLGEAVRSHWGIENQVHWVLDVTFHEDQSRIRQGAAAAHMSVLRHIALNVVRHHPRKRLSIRTRQLVAGWDDASLLQLLRGS